MALRLYNSLSKKIEEFTPHDKNKVKMYVCGITPYDTTHLGHAFTYVFFDVLIRYLKSSGFDVTYTQNVTDINDRDNDILKRAKEQGIAWQNLANFWTDKFLEDMHALNWTMPDHYLWASAHIPGMIKQIGELLTNNIAYQKNGGVYLDISKSPNFGKLSKLSEKEMMKVAREFDEDLDNPDKKNPLDVTLWRPTITDQSPHIPSFDSPYGEGRPGWHLECSAMGICSLGEQIDIHGGGVDLIYPHHEAEIAQAEGASNKIPFVKYWIHTQLVSYQGNKMSKSLGNLVLISDLLGKHSANTIRFVLLSHHYREPWEFSEDELIEAAKKVNIIKQIIKSESKNNNSTFQQFNNSLDEDMNTPGALEVLLKTENKEEIKQMTDILGFKF
jgi:cysteinyl-tRNA synthetase